MADSGVILRSLNKSSGVYYPVLTPNIQGFNSAAEAGANEVAGQYNIYIYLVVNVVIHMFHIIYYYLYVCM